MSLYEYDMMMFYADHGWCGHARRGEYVCKKCGVCYACCACRGPHVPVTDPWLTQWGLV